MPPKQKILHIISLSLPVGSTSCFQSLSSWSTHLPPLAQTAFSFQELQKQSSSCPTPILAPARRGELEQAFSQCWWLMWGVGGKRGTGETGSTCGTSSDGRQAIRRGSGLLAHMGSRFLDYLDRAAPVGQRSDDNS